jgi:hypothetical protein
MKNPEWVAVDDSEGNKTDRLEVPGGWLYRVRVQGHVSLAFVPRPAETPASVAARRKDSTKITYGGVAYWFPRACPTCGKSGRAAFDPKGGAHIRFEACGHEARPEA